MELFKLFGTIAIQNAEANSDIDETTSKAGNAKNKIVDSFKKIGAAVVTYFAVDRIVDFGKACINAAADASAMESQFSQVFGDLEGQAAENLSALADEAGIVVNRMKSSYTKIAAFAKTSGMETEDALSLADRAMKAVADSAAFYDRSLEDTTESLQSFLKGNYENDAALGLSCTETTRNAAANALYGKSFNELSESQKQLTLLKMVEDANALSGALGQAARESDTWTNQTGNLKQAWTDFTAAIGEHFLPVAVKAVKWLSEKMPEVQAFVTEAIAEIGRVITELEPTVNVLFTAVSNLWQTVLQPCLKAIGAFIKDVLAPAFVVVFKDIIVPNVQAAFGFIQEAWEKLLKPVFNGITDFLTGVFTGNWKQAFQGLVNIVKSIFSGIVTQVKKPINQVINLVNSFIRGLNKLKIPDWVPGFGGKGINIPLIPTLEKGGVLKKGQTGLLEGNGAEAVVPLDQNRAWISAVARDMKDVGIGGQNDVLEYYLQKLTDMLADYFPQLLNAAGHDIVTNDGVIIARYAPMLNNELGRISSRKDRGR